MELKCRNCGAAIADGVTICPYCDSEITFESKANNSEAASQDTSGISFELRTVGKGDEIFAIDSAETIKSYLVKWNMGELDEYMEIHASQPIYGIDYLGVRKVESGDFQLEISKNDTYYEKDEECTFEELLSTYIDFYEGRFNPDLILDKYKDLLVIDNVLVERLRDNVYGKKVLIGLRNYLHSGTTVAGYIALLRNFTSKNSDMAMPDIHSDLFKKVYDRISDKLSADERAICWTDNGIFKHGVSGLMITDKRLFFVNKKSISILPIKDIASIRCESPLEYPQYINGNAEQKVCYPSEAGSVVLGLICTMASDFNDSGYKIKIY